MSYLLIVIIGAVAGWVTGQAVNGSDMGVGIDFLAGAIGAVVAVVLFRLLGPAVANGLIMSATVAIIGAIASLFAMRHFMKARLVPVTRTRRR
jgi:uncharacterized membrane protein YeaQ/YmgE (transglycosylase-associated protein family)